ncbi:MAG: hypothetical protein RSA10_01510 [Bacilli bacterium]
MHEKVIKLIEAPLGEVNIKVDKVEYVKEGNVYYLRIIIDKEPFVDVESCVVATKIINPLIDTIDNIFDESYILDVCSKEKGEN